CARTFYAMDYW
nr:immunoglobulin heavy chain junction region [Mus musculus]NSM05928.1 immunoglobulin heavy chain junction region [Mus musculus]NSM07485.1 immunoglobulin heavy chain junction region [Mus musculus]NSM08027.1 immunoglobulin heavy chain junction region [Mus musculus]